MFTVKARNIQHCARTFEYSREPIKRPVLVRCCSPTCYARAYAWNGGVRSNGPKLSDRGWRDKTWITEKGSTGSLCSLERVVRPMGREAARNDHLLTVCTASRITSRTSFGRANIAT